LRISTENSRLITRSIFLFNASFAAMKT